MDKTAQIKEVLELEKFAEELIVAPEAERLEMIEELSRRTEFLCMFNECSELLDSIKKFKAPGIKSSYLGYEGGGEKSATFFQVDSDVSFTISLKIEKI